MDMLANDIADVLSNGDYNIDVDAADVLTALPDFVAPAHTRRLTRQNRHYANRPLPWTFGRRRRCHDHLIRSPG